MILEAAPASHTRADTHSEHRFPAPSSKGRKDVVNQCLEFGADTAFKCSYCCRDCHCPASACMQLQEALLQCQLVVT